MPEFINTGSTPYARVFDGSNQCWSSNHMNNEAFIVAVQGWMNEKLAANGHVFLNEVYDNLGFPRTRDGVIVGWLKGSRVEIEIVDDSESGGIILNFSPDGVIWDKI